MAVTALQGDQTFPLESAPNEPAATFSTNLSHLTKIDPKSDGFPSSLHDALYSEDYPKFIASLTKTEICDFINFLDKVLKNVPPHSDLFKKCLRALRKLCGQVGRLPSSYMIAEEQLSKRGDSFVASGGFSDVWTGTFCQRQVALKILRVTISSNQAKILKASVKLVHLNTPTEKKKALCKEVVVWKQLSHQNILPFLGYSLMKSQPCMVSEWMNHGNIVTYLKNHPGKNRFELLSGVAEGLDYLHSFGVVHADLKGPNILIDNLECARIADFGLNSITINDFSQNASSNPDNRGTARWMAPELLNVEGSNTPRPTKEGDIYSLAMVVIEVFTCSAPFYPLPNNAVIIRVASGVRPPRPEEARKLGLSDNAWGVVQACWQQEPHLRPKLSDVLQSFKTAAAAHGQAGPSGRGDFVGEPLPPAVSRSSSHSSYTQKSNSSVHIDPGAISDDSPLHDDVGTQKGHVSPPPSPSPEKASNALSFMSLFSLKRKPTTFKVSRPTPLTTRLKSMFKTQVVTLVKHD